MSDNKIKYPLEYKTSPDYTGVWDSDDNVVFGIITDGGDRPVHREWACQIGMTKHQLKHTVKCLNALADVENPEAVKELMDNMRNRTGDISTVVQDVSKMFDILKKIRFTDDMDAQPVGTVRNDP